jgi:uncharacterized damage-inducible protein DinB
MSLYRSYRCQPSLPLRLHPVTWRRRRSAGIAAWFDETFAASLQKLEGISGETLTKMVDFRGMFQLPAVGFIQLALNHSIHHRGQLSMYLRPMGAKVPAIYGESYDTTQARLAKEGKAS